jgi:hypothetical protein
MSYYFMIRRLRGPAFLLLVGVLALLNQMHILSWGKSWPLYLILAGLLALAERAALSAEGGYPQGPYPGQPYPGPNPGANPGPNPNANPGSYQGNAPDAGASAPSASTGIPPYPGQPAAIVPVVPHDLLKDNSEEGSL